MNIQFDGKSEDLVFIEDGFTFPSMSKKVQYNESSHASMRRRRRSVREPFSFSVPLIILNDGNELSRDEVNERVSEFLFSDGPKVMKIKDSNWHFIGEFNGPYELPNWINVFTKIEVEFTSEYSHKIYDVPRIQQGDNFTITSKTQTPTVPLIELSGLTGDDVQISNSSDSFQRIRLSGTLPANLTIDIENERIYETVSGVDRSNLLRIDSDFEHFKVKDGDVITLINASDTAQAKLTYNELML